MMPTILRSNAYGPLSVQNWEAFEREIGTSVPSPYREFLLEHNGGTPQNAFFLAPNDPLDGNKSPLSPREVVCFFALHHADSDTSGEEAMRAFPLQEAWRDLKEEQPDSHLLPIGQDWSGNTICLGFEGEERGQIFFYDHEYEVASLLAANFEVFLKLLKLNPNF